MDQIGLNQLDANLITTLSRYIDEYKWGWGIARRQLRMRFNADITVQELQRIYKQAKENKKTERSCKKHTKVF